MTEYIGHFEVLGVLGSGSYGVVLKCRDTNTGKLVAIKRFREEKRMLSSHRKSSNREYHFLTTLNHPNVIHQITAFTVNKLPHLVLELLDGALLNTIQTFPNGVCGCVVRSWGKKLLEGLAYLHKNEIAHRDIKPENILIAEESGVPPSTQCSSSCTINQVGTKVKICDLGFARIIPRTGKLLQEYNHLKATGGDTHQITTNSSSSHSRDRARPVTQYVSTRWYRSPELLLGQDYDHSIDIWALGCVLSELATGLPLFPGANDEGQWQEIQQRTGVHLNNYQVIPKGKKAPNPQKTITICTCGYGFQSDFVVSPKTTFCYQHLLPRLGKDGAGVIARMLCLNPHCRISALEALSHPFFQSDGPVIISRPESDSKNAIADEFANQPAVELDRGICLDHTSVVAESVHSNGTFATMHTYNNATHQIAPQNSSHQALPTEHPGVTQATVVPPQAQAAKTGQLLLQPSQQQQQQQQLQQHHQQHLDQVPQLQSHPSNHSEGTNSANALAHQMQLLQLQQQQQQQQQNSITPLPSPLPSPPLTQQSSLTHHRQSNTVHGTKSPTHSPSTSSHYLPVGHGRMNPGNGTTGYNNLPTSPTHQQQQLHHHQQQHPHPNLLPQMMNAGNSGVRSQHLSGLSGQIQPGPFTNTPSGGSHSQLHSVQSDQYHPHPDLQQQYAQQQQQHPLTGRHDMMPSQHQQQQQQFNAYGSTPHEQYYYAGGSQNHHYPGHFTHNPQGFGKMRPSHELDSNLDAMSIVSSSESLFGGLSVLSLPQAPGTTPYVHNVQQTQQQQLQQQQYQLMMQQQSQNHYYNQFPQGPGPTSPHPHPNQRQHQLQQQQNMNMNMKSGYGQTGVHHHPQQQQHTSTAKPGRPLQNYHTLPSKFNPAQVMYGGGDVSLNTLGGANGYRTPNGNKSIHPAHDGSITPSQILTPSSSTNTIASHQHQHPPLPGNPSGHHPNINDPLFIDGQPLLTSTPSSRTGADEYPTTPSYGPIAAPAAQQHHTGQTNFQRQQSRLAQHHYNSLPRLQGQHGRSKLTNTHSPPNGSVTPSHSGMSMHHGSVMLSQHQPGHSPVSSMQQQQQQQQRGTPTRSPKVSGEPSPQLQGTSRSGQFNLFKPQHQDRRKWANKTVNLTKQFRTQEESNESLLIDNAESDKNEQEYY